MQTQRNWSSLDLHLAAYLEYRGIPIVLANLGGRVVFTAPLSDELHTLISVFNQNDSVPIADYVGALRSMKARMYAARSSSLEVRRG